MKMHWPVAVAISIFACSVFKPPVGIARDDGRGEVKDAGLARDARASEGPWWIASDEHGCERARAPTSQDRPTVDDVGNDLSPLYFAMSKIVLGGTPDDKTASSGSINWRDIGFDMDGVCTNSASCPGVSDKACLNAAITPFDGRDCRDNELGKLSELAAASPVLAELFGYSEEDWNCELHRGGFGVILKISDYNGQLDDSSVRFDMYTSTGLQLPPGWNCRDSIDKPLNQDWPSYADWLSSAHWRIAEQSVDTSAVRLGDQVPNSVAGDGTAFVRDGYFFAKIPDGQPLWFDGEKTPIPGFRFLMRRGVMVGQLVRQPDDSWVIRDGTVAFVVLPADHVAAFQQIGFCENMCNAFGTMKQYAESQVDTLSGTDQIQPAIPCDALSVGIAFEARQATATTSDVVVASDPVLCPDPRHPSLPRQGCTCQADGATCLTP